VRAAHPRDEARNRPGGCEGEPGDDSGSPPGEARDEPDQEDDGEREERKVDPVPQEAAVRIEVPQELRVETFWDRPIVGVTLMRDQIVEGVVRATRGQEVIVVPEIAEAQTRDGEESRRQRRSEPVGDAACRSGTSIEFGNCLGAPVDAAMNYFNSIANLRHQYVPPPRAPQLLQ